MAEIQFSPFGTLYRSKDRVVLGIHFDNDGTFSAFTDNIGRLAARPSLIAEMLRRVVAETVLQEVTQAFIANLPLAMNMEQETTKYGIRVVSSHPRQQNTSSQQRMGDLYRRMQAAQRSGDVDAVRAVRDDFERLREEYRTSLQLLADKPGTLKTSHNLSSGLFRQRALKVLSTLTNPSLLKMLVGQTSVTVGLGNIMALDAIKTPSATQYILKRGRTGTRLDILWRHLEFGTGIHKINQAVNGGDEGSFGSRFKLTDSRGGWFYGRRADSALHLLGSRPIEALYTQKGWFRGIQSFNTAIHGQLAELLAGPGSTLWG